MCPLDEKSKKLINYYYATWHSMKYNIKNFTPDVLQGYCTDIGDYCQDQDDVL